MGGEVKRQNLPLSSFQLTPPQQGTKWTWEGERSKNEIQGQGPPPPPQGGSDPKSLWGRDLSILGFVETEALQHEAPAWQGLAAVKGSDSASPRAQRRHPILSYIYIYTSESGRSK